jgi:hypothetical protein
VNILSIEPTPSPNTMKLNLDESLPKGENRNYSQDKRESAPDYVKQLLAIDGVKGLYHVADFIALERNGKVDWKEILPHARAVFESGSEDGSGGQAEERSTAISKGYGEINVFIQKFKSLPMQVKLTNDGEEKRFGLPERFTNAAMEAASSSPNMVMERKWEEQSPRYGEMDEIGENIVDEISAAYDEERLKQLVKQAFDPKASDEHPKSKQAPKVTLEMLDDPDWKNRYAALDRMDPTLEDLPVLSKALHDPKLSIRRLATVYFGMIEKPEVLPYLYEALQDKSVTVRRTAGDCLSDLGDPDAIGSMKEALKDSSRIVRWRAAMFLYEVGDESALDALREAEDDPEFEVDLQIKMAIERIESGETAKGSVWKQMTEAYRK